MSALPRHRMLIGGQWVEPAGGQWLQSENPFTGKAWAEIPRGGAEDVDRAVQAAWQAFRGPWRSMTASARGAILHRFGDLVAENAELKGLLTQVTSAIEAHLAYAKKIGEKVHASK